VKEEVANARQNDPMTQRNSNRAHRAGHTVLAEALANPARRNSNKKTHFCRE